MNYYEKYIKYKLKYNILKNNLHMFGGINVTRSQIFNLFMRKDLIMLIFSTPTPSPIPLPIHDDSANVDDDTTEIVQKKKPQKRKKNSDNIIEQKQQEIVINEDIEDMKEPEIIINQLPDKRTKRPPQSLADFHTTNLTPKILYNLSPESKRRLAEDIEGDNEAIQYATNLAEESDPDYIQYNNYGKLIEMWIADNMRCPCCKQFTLRRYDNPNMPIVDVVCINELHTIDDGVRFFQIKSSNGVYFRGIPYFNYSPEENMRNIDNSKYITAKNIIRVGSKNFGKHVHNITPYDDDDIKILLVGYICVTYVEDTENQKLFINRTNSFIVLPKRHNISRNLFDGVEKKQSELITDRWYYRYCTRDKRNMAQEKHPIIKFNIRSNNVITFSNLKELFSTSLVIDLNYEKIENYTIISNPMISMIEDLIQY